MKFWGSGHHYSNDWIARRFIGHPSHLTQTLLEFWKIILNTEGSHVITYSQTVKVGLELASKDAVWTCIWQLCALYFFLSSAATESCNIWTKKGNRNNNKDKHLKRRQRKSSNVQNDHSSAFWGSGGDPWRCQVWWSGGRRVACCQSSRSVM